MALDAAVLELALHPFREVPTAPGMERVEEDGVLCFFHPYPNAQPVEPLGLAVKSWAAWRQLRFRTPPRDPSRRKEIFEPSQ